MLSQLQSYVNAGIDRLQKKYPPNRVVALLLVVLAAPAAALGAYVAVWVPAHFPGLPTFTAGQYTAFALTGAGIVALAGITAAYKFIDGVQKDQALTAHLANAGEERQHERDLAKIRAATERAVAIATADNPDVAGEKIAELEQPPQPPAPGGVGGVSLPDHPGAPAPVATDANATEPRMG